MAVNPHSVTVPA